MKKLLALLLVLISAFTLFACSGEPSGTMVTTLKEFTDYFDDNMPTGDFSYKFKIKHEEKTKTVDTEEKITLKADGIWNYIDDEVLDTAEYDITLKTVEKVATINGNKKTTTTLKENVIFILRGNDYDKYFDVSLKTKKSGYVDSKYDVKVMGNDMSSISVEDIASLDAIVNLIEKSYINGVAYIDGDKLTIIDSSSDEHTEIVVKSSKGKIKTIKVKTETTYGKSSLDITLTDEKKITAPKDKTDYVGYKSL